MNSFAVRALVELGRPQAALDLSRRMCRDAEDLGPTIRAVALLAAAQAWNCSEPTGADGRSESLLVEARQLADSVGSAEVVADIDKEWGLQRLGHGLPELATLPLRAACLHWLATGHRGQVGEAVEALAQALHQTGRSDVADRLLAGSAEGHLTAPQLAALVPLLASAGRSESATPDDAPLRAAGAAL